MEHMTVLLSIASIINGDGPLWEKGLLVVVIGLAGVFLVLILFFFMIIIMEKISTAAERASKK